MSRFTEACVISPLPDDTWRLHEPLIYDVGAVDSGEQVVVPEGFVTDFASVPRGLWNIFPRWGRWGHAAIVHDFLYWKKPYPRERADEIFLEAMLVLGTPSWKAKTMYRAVRLFGGKAWKDNVGRERILPERPKITDWE